MLNQFSRLLCELYEAADHAPLKDYPEALLRLLQRALPFDGAMAGCGDTPADAPGDLLIDCAYVYGRDRVLLDDYAAVAHGDPVAAALIAGLRRPLICPCVRVYAQAGLRGLHQMAQRHGIDHLLLFGTPPAPGRAAQWLALYRSGRAAFLNEHAIWLGALWPHLLRCTRTGFARFLQRQQDGAGHALVSARGLVLATDEGFRRLYRQEWRADPGMRLGGALWERLQRCARYAGTHVNVSAQAQGGCLLCQASARSAADRLTPAERQVALQYAAGRSHREVARDLAISVNTVHSHLAHVYDKLDIHRKTELVRRLARDG